MRVLIEPSQDDIGLGERRFEHGTIFYLLSRCCGAKMSVGDAKNTRGNYSCSSCGSTDTLPHFSEAKGVDGLAWIRVRESSGRLVAGILHDWLCWYFGSFRGFEVEIE